MNEDMETSQFAERDRGAFAAVDDALRTYPLDSPPSTLVSGVMARVHALTPMPQFRLTWFDYAMGLFGAVMFGLGLVLWQLVPTQAIVDAVNQIDFAFPQSDVTIWIIITLGGEAIVGVFAVVLVLLVSERMWTQRSFRTLGAD